MKPPTGKHHNDLVLVRRLGENEGGSGEGGGRVGINVEGEVMTDRAVGPRATNVKETVRVARKKRKDRMELDDGCRNVVGQG
jgi:hypothetical protein